MLVGPGHLRGHRRPGGCRRAAGVPRPAGQTFPPAIRARVHLVYLPMDDGDENALIVNALQRHASIVVQKSLVEGFGLTVTEAMWKSRPMIASAVGGIQDQITDRRDGLLIADPTDLDAFAGALRPARRPGARRAARRGRAPTRARRVPRRSSPDASTSISSPASSGWLSRLITVSGPVAVGRTLVGPAPVINPGTSSPQPRALTALAITNSEVMRAAVACAPMRSTSRGQGGEMVLGGGWPAEAAAATFN